MNRRRWQDVKALLAELLEREPSERAELLARAYSEDPTVADEVRDLPAHHREAEAVFDRPLVDLRREKGSETGTDTVTVDAEPTSLDDRERWLGGALETLESAPEADERRRDDAR